MSPDAVAMLTEAERLEVLQALGRDGARNADRVIVAVERIITERRRAPWTWPMRSCGELFEFTVDGRPDYLRCQSPITDGGEHFWSHHGSEIRWRYCDDPD